MKKVLEESNVLFGSSIFIGKEMLDDAVSPECLMDYHISRVFQSLCMALERDKSEIVTITDNDDGKSIDLTVYVFTKEELLELICAARLEPGDIAVDGVKL